MQDDPVGILTGSKIKKLDSDTKEQVSIGLSDFHNSEQQKSLENSLSFAKGAFELSINESENKKNFYKILCASMIINNLIV